MQASGSPLIACDDTASTRSSSPRRRTFVRVLRVSLLMMAASLSGEVSVQEGVDTRPYRRGHFLLGV
jgi:hypothetical protein